MIWAGVHTAAVRRSIINVDTDVAHLAGATRKPVWLLLPLAPDSRWLLERADSPWYPTMRLFRQEIADDWEQPILLLAQELRQLNS